MQSRSLWKWASITSVDSIASEPIMLNRSGGWILIYSHAIFTIVAAADTTLDHGLPGVETRHRRNQPVIQLSERVTLVSTLPLWTSGSPGGRREGFPNWSWAGWNHPVRIIHITSANARNSSFAQFARSNEVVKLVIQLSTGQKMPFFEYCNRRGTLETFE